MFERLKGKGTPSTRQEDPAHSAVFDALNAFYARAGMRRAEEYPTSTVGPYTQTTYLDHGNGNGDVTAIEILGDVATLRRPPLGIFRRQTDSSGRVIFTHARLQADGRHQYRDTTGTVVTSEGKRLTTQQRRASRADGKKLAAQLAAEVAAQISSSKLDPNPKYNTDGTIIKSEQQHIQH